MKRTTKLVSVLLAVLIALSSFAILPISAFDHSSKAPGSSYEFGDVNRDGVVDIIDATIVQKYSVDKATLDNEQKILGDVNGDGEVDILDATLVQKFVVDRIDKFPVEDKLPTEPTTIEEPTEAPEGDYYILGTMNGWSVSDDYKLTANEAADGEFVFTGLKLKTTDKFKVAYSVAGAEPKMWFPNGYNDNYGQHGEITADGTYDLYFRPDGQGGEDWFKGVIYLEAKEAPTAEPDTTAKPEPDTTVKPEPDTTVKPEPDTTAKPEPDTTAKPEPQTTVMPEPQTTVMPEPDTTAAPEPGEEGYYIVGTMTDWGINPDYKLTANEAAEGEYMFTGLNLTPTDQFKVVYSEDGLVAKTWYPEGMDNNFGQNGEIKAVGVYDIYFRPDGQGGEDWFNGVIYAANQDEPQPTEEVTTAAPEPDTTAEPGETITVKFTDALGWGDVHVYYWPNGAEWPGTAMEKAEVNDFGQQVYTAEIPANVDGIIFNGNGNQTVDIKTDIADGAQWYTIDEKEGKNYKVVLVGEVPTEEPKPTDEPDTTAAPEPGEEGYYIVGTMTDWGINPDYKLTANEAAEGEYMFTGLNLTPTDQFKVVYSEDGSVAKTWYPEGMDNNFGQNGEIKTVGVYDIYFRPDGQGGEDWFNGVIYAANQDEPQPTEEVTTAAPEPDTTAEPGETITVKFTDALGWGDVHVYYWPNGAEWPGTAMEKAEVNDYGQQVYTAEIPANVDGIIFNGNGNQTVDIKTDIADGAQWYTIDEKEGNNYKVVLVGEVPTEEPKPTDEPDTTAAPEPGEEGYYIVGTMTDWGINPDYKLTANEAAEGEYMFTGLNLTPTDQFKVVYSEDGSVAKTWYPEGMDNNFGQNGEIKAVGVYDIYFRPDGQGGEDWFNGVIYAANQDEPQPTEEVTTAAPEPDTTAEPGETITVKFTDALGWGDVHVYYWDNGAEWPGTAMEKAEVNDYGQQVYTAEIPADVEGIIFNGNGKQTVDIKTDIADGAQWYTIDEKEGTAYKVVLVTDEEPTEEATTAADEPDTTAEPSTPECIGAILLTDNFNWGTAYVYAWDADGNSLYGAWPGTEIKETKTNDMDQTQFVVEVPAGAAGVIVNNGAGAQTEDITDFSFDGYWMDGTTNELGHYLVTGYNVGETPTDEPTQEPSEEGTTAQETTPSPTSLFKITDNLKWGDAYLYAWDADGNALKGEWPGTKVADKTTNELGEDQFIIAIPAGAAGIILNNGAGAQTVDITDFDCDGYWMDGTKDNDGHYNVLKFNEGGTPTVAPTEEATTAEPATNPEPASTFLLTDNFGWGKAYVYAWDAEGNALLGEWPGTDDVKTTKNELDETQFIVEVPAGAAGIIVNNGTGAQTEDITDFSFDGYWMDGTTNELGHYLVTGYNVDENPTDAPETTAAPEPETTAAPAGTITVKFTDALGWGAANVYYWPNGAEWPGTAMTKAEVNDYGQQVYTAEIPADVTGIIFNGNGNQTVDIKDGIADGAQWYTIDEKEGTAYKVVLVTDEEPTEEATTAADEPDTTAEPSTPECIGAILLTDNFNWGTAYVYAWDADGNSLYGDWPGTEVKETRTNDMGETQFVINIPDGAAGIVVNNNKGAQTEDITDFVSYDGYWMDGTTDDLGHYLVTGYKDGEEPTAKPSEEATTAEVTEPATKPEVEVESTFLLTDNFGWGKGYVYAWDAEGNSIYGDWPGIEIKETTTNDMGETQFVVEVPKGAAGVIVNNNNGAQTEDIKDFSYDGYWMDGTTNELGHYMVTGYNVDENPTDAPETTAAPEPTEEGTTAAPAGTITVKFTDALSWGDVHVYYWDNGAEWPGTAMTKAEVNDYGQQVYTAEIPANVDGIIFNGNGNQTVDIKTDIADGAQWYTIDEKEGTAYKVVLVGETPTEAATTAAPETTEAPTEPATDPEPASTFLLTDNFDWGKAYVYAWDGDGNELYGEWPGTEIKETKTNDMDQTQFVVEVPEGAVGVIVNNNAGAQTEDITNFSFDGYWMDGTTNELGHYLVTGYNVDENPTDAPETTAAPEPTEEGTTAAPAGTITVKFTDALSWGDVHVYYWDNGAEWPGTAMTKAEVNDYGQQVYTAEIPADVTGIIFNGNGNQTVDIKTDIADGAQWYTVDEKEGNNYKVTLVGSEPATEQPTDATEQPTTVETFPKSFYVDFTAVLGQGTNWYAWTWDDSHDGVWRPVEKFGYVASYDNVVFASFNTDVPDWNNKVVQTENVKVEDGNTLYILNEKDESGNLKTSWKGAEQPTTAEPTVVTEPTEEPTETTPANTITVKFTDALSWGDVHVYYWNNGAEWPGTAMEKAEVNDFGQQVYTAEIPADVEGIIFNGNGNQTVDIKTGITDGAQWYTVDEKEGNNYKVTLVGSEPATEQPTEVVEPTTEAPTEATDPTEDQNDTITIKFTDALGWGDVHVYYWNNGAEWPGTAMEKAEVNDFGQQVYTAEIPADVEGIIFNGNGNQTVDIKTDIADGAQWYTVNEKEGNNYKVTLVGEETQPTEDPTPEPTGTTVKLQPNSNWTQSGARFAIYVFNNSTGANTWADMTAVGDGTYTVTIPEGTWDKVIFVRMNPSATANNWNNKWNQSANLDITDGKLYTVPSNSWDNWTA